MPNNGALSYTARVQWNTVDGSHWIEARADSMEEATRKAQEAAVIMGWTPRRWWQFLRYGEEA